MSAQEKQVSKPNLPRIKLTVPLVSFVVILLAVSLSYFIALNRQSGRPSTPSPAKSEVSETAQLVSAISLPQPAYDSRMSLEKALKLRRSQRSFKDEALSLKQVSQILWAAQGVTSDWGGRTAPSAKSTYPLTVYLLSYKISDLNPGIYRYLSGDREPVHKLMMIKPGSFRDDLAKIVGQNSLKEPPAVLVITGNFAKMAAAFDGKKADNSVYLEAGHAAQNVYLEAESLSLGTVTLVSSDSEKIIDLLSIPPEETIIYLMPLGVPKT